MYNFPVLCGVCVHVGLTVCMYVCVFNIVFNMDISLHMQFPEIEDL
jgi:hypothetical protein